MGVGCEWDRMIWVRRERCEEGDEHDECRGRRAMSEAMRSRERKEGGLKLRFGQKERDQQRKR